MSIKDKIINSAKELTNIYSLTGLGMLLAIRIILGIIANPTMALFGYTLKISFNFIPITVAAIMFGPIGAGLVGSVGDILSFFINSAGGTYFPGFTINGFITGLILGLFLYKNINKISNIIIAYLVNAIAIEILLSAFWFTCLYGNTYTFYVLQRLLFECIKAVPTVILMITFCKVALRIPVKNKIRKK